MRDRDYGMSGESAAWHPSAASACRDDSVATTSLTTADAGGERREPAASGKTQVERLGQFVSSARLEDISAAAREQLKLRVLDSLGCALGALDGAPVRMVGEEVREFGGAPLATLIGAGRSAPDRAALYNGALVRYLDFNDSFLAPGETCHPSDNLAPVLAACEYAHTDGATLLAALAVAYQVQNRLSELAPVRAKGFDHTTQGAYAVAAGVARALGLDPSRTANAVAIAGPFEIDWSREDLESVTRTILKKYNAEIHSQSAIEALLELRAAHGIEADQVERVELDTFQVAYDIIGGGEEGSKYEIRTKEQADHSLPYLLAVALLDGQVLPEQYLPQRVAADDVQALLRRVEVNPDPELSRRFPEQHSAHVRVRLHDGRVLEREQHDYEGFAAGRWAGTPWRRSSTALPSVTSMPSAVPGSGSRSATWSSSPSST